VGDEGGEAFEEFANILPVPSSTFSSLSRKKRRRFGNVSVHILTGTCGMTSSTNFAQRGGVPANAEIEQIEMHSWGAMAAVFFAAQEGHGQRCWQEKLITNVRPHRRQTARANPSPGNPHVRKSRRAASACWGTEGVSL